MRNLRSTLPDACPGHWDTADGREMAELYLAMPRADLAKAGLSDMALANAQYLENMSAGTVTFQSAIAMQTAAKERIRWLSAHLAATEARCEQVEAALQYYADRSGGQIARDTFAKIGGRR